MDVAALTALARPEIRALEPYASARAAGPPPAGAVLLNANELPWPPAPGSELNRYPAPQPVTIRRRLAEIYGAGEDSLLLTRGSDEGIDLLVRVFCTAYRDRVAICPPCFGMYEIAARIQGAGVERLPLVSSHDAALAGIDRPGLAASGARLIFLCSPNNPTGAVIPRAEILALAAALAGRALVVVDEAYIEFARAPSLVADLAAVPNLVVLRTLSKAWGLAGARLGALIARPEVVALAARIIAPYPISRPAADSVCAALTPAGVRRMQRNVIRIRRERARLHEALGRLPAVEAVFPSEANFLLIQCRAGKRLAAAARQAGILLREQSAQTGLADCVRITIGTKRENDRLLAFLEGRQ